MSNPIVSIITVALNANGFLEKTIKSVLAQTYKRIEYIIIDGGSKDNSIELIRQYHDYISYWVSEPDDGISDAFNKGIRASTGEWIVFLNAGDVFYHNNVVSDWVLYEDGNDIVTSFAIYDDNEKRTIPKALVNNRHSLVKKSMISHQATMVRREIFDRYGLFSKEYNIRMDYEFWLRVLKTVNFTFIPIKAIRYDTSGTSFVNKKIFFVEEIRANREQLSRLSGLYWNTLLRIKKIVKRILRKQ